MRRNLVLARVGASSLHPGWLEGGTGEDRSWDLYLSPYQEIEEQDPDVQVGEVLVGPKWTGIREVLATWDGWRRYDRIWLPDDDIRATRPAIDRMFEIAGGVGLDLFAPALDDESHYAHFIGMQNRSFFGRYVGFVEIMIPGFSRPALERLLPTLDEGDTGWGWGLDSVWPKLLEYRGVGLIDAVTVTHTRPVGVLRDQDLRRRVGAESDRLLAAHGCAQEHVTFGAFGPDLAPLALAPEELLSRLVAGWQHLIERDPRVLWWVAQFQQRHAAGLPYPVEGTPGGRGPRAEVAP